MNKRFMPRQSYTTGSKNKYDSHARLSGAVMIEAYAELKKALKALEANPENKGAEGIKDEVIRFLLSDSPWHHYLTVKGHELPIERTLRQMGVEV